MPPKKTTAKEHFVYIILYEEYCSPEEGGEGGETRPIQVHSHVDAANDMAEAHFEYLNRHDADLTPDVERNVDPDDQTLTVAWYGQIGYKRTRVVKMPLFGGTITSTKKPASKAPKKSKAKKIPIISSDSSQEEDEDEDEVVVQKSNKVKPSTVAESATKAGTKRMASTSLEDDDDDDEEIDSILPVGQVNCLMDLSFLVTGALDPWTRDQVIAIIKEFGGKIARKIEASLDYVVMGTNPGAKKLIELEKTENSSIKRLDLRGLYDLISDESSGEGPWKTQKSIRRACELAYKGPKRLRKAP